MASDIAQQQDWKLNDLLVVEKLPQWQKLKALGLDSVSSPIARRYLPLQWFNESFFEILGNLAVGFAPKSELPFAVALCVGDREFLAARAGQSDVRLYSLSAAPHHGNDQVIWSVAIRNGPAHGADLGRTCPSGEQGKEKSARVTSEIKSDRYGLLAIRKQQ
jgi:hypothetical protein